MDPVQSLILFLNCLSFLADLLMSRSVFHNMLPLNLNEFSPYLTVFVPGSWTRSFYSKIGICGSRFEEIPKKGGIFEVKHLYTSTSNVCNFLVCILCSSLFCRSSSKVDP